MKSWESPRVHEDLWNYHHTPQRQRCSKYLITSCTQRSLHHHVITDQNLPENWSSSPALKALDLGCQSSDFEQYLHNMSDITANHCISFHIIQSLSWPCFSLPHMSSLVVWERTVYTYIHIRTCHRLSSTNHRISLPVVTYCLSMPSTLQTSLPLWPGFFLKLNLSFALAVMKVRSRWKCQGHLVIGCSHLIRGTLGPFHIGPEWLTD